MYNTAKDDKYIEKTILPFKKNVNHEENLHNKTESTLMTHWVTVCTDDFADTTLPSLRHYINESNYIRYSLDITVYAIYFVHTES